MVLLRSRWAAMPLIAMLTVALVCGVAAAPAWAHFTAAVGGGWSAGLSHPFSGIDHVVAMVAVGLWGAQMGRPALYLFPLCFPLLMAAGAGLSFAGIDLPGAEDGVAVSVALLGVLLAVAARPSLLVGGAVVGLFGLFHGYAHGAEMPEAAEPLLYGLGFLAGTVMLHVIGIGFGMIAQSPLGQRLLPLGAAAITGIGITLTLAL